MTSEIKLAFDDEKLHALEFSLQKENTTVQECMDKALQQLYEKTVPEPLREYVESKAAPAPKAKRPSRPATPKHQPKAEPPRAAPSAIELRNEEESK